MEEGIDDTTIYNISDIPPLFLIAQVSEVGCLGTLCKGSSLGVRGENDVCCLGTDLLKLRKDRHSDDVQITRLYSEPSNGNYFCLGPMN